MGKIYTFNNKIITINNKWCEEYVEPTPVDPLNPLGLPANTVRVRTSDGNAPIKTEYTTYETATLVPGTSDVYDVYKSGTSFSSLFKYSTNIVEVLGANTSNVTSMSVMFYDCVSLTTVSLFDTSNVTSISEMFAHCTSISTIPLFDTSNVTNMKNMFDSSSLQYVPLLDTSKVTNTYAMFENCVNVERGALALYNQMGTQANPPSRHDRTFRNCGSNTTSGAAELAQIPDDWK